MTNVGIRRETAGFETHRDRHGHWRVWEGYHDRSPHVHRLAATARSTLD